MKITYRQLLESIPYLRDLNEMEFMPRTSLELSKLVKKIDIEMETFREIQAKLNAKYENRPEDEAKRAKQDAKAEEEYTELLTTELELNVRTIPFSVLERTNKPFKPQLFTALDWLIEEPQEEDAPVNEAPKQIVH